MVLSPKNALFIKALAFLNCERYASIGAKNNQGSLLECEPATCLEMGLACNGSPNRS